MHPYWLEFSQVALAHALAVASPGPDFALVVRQSLAHGRGTAVWTSLGIGTAILVHVGASLLGLGALLRGSEAWFNAMKFAGAAYIAWLGVQCLRSRRRMAGPGGADPVPPPRRPGRHGAFALGFLTNVLNPKATLFFLSLFLLVVSPLTPKPVQALYGGWMAAATAGWFSLVSLTFTRTAVRERFLRQGHWIDRALGVVFLGFAVSLVLATAR